MKAIIGGVVLLALGLALFYFSRRQAGPVDYVKLPGLYDCADFGLPDASFKWIRISPEFALSGSKPDFPGEEFPLGKLSPIVPHSDHRDQPRAGQVEFAMGLVHHPSFDLDPFTPAKIQGFRNHIVLTAKRRDQVFEVHCSRVE